jgi:hypothetical protein
MATVLRATPALLLAALAACASRDPRAELEIVEAETYWVVDAPRGGSHYLAPAVRVRIRSKAEEPILSIQATANFRRVGETEVWGSGWEQVTRAAKPLPPGGETVVVLRSDGRYNSPGTPESMFAHALFRDVTTEVYLRIGSSAWAKMVEIPVERRIGARGVAELAAP